MEQNPVNQEKKSIFDRMEMKEFVESKKIQLEDFALIKELALQPGIYDLHNLFEMSQKNSGRELQTMIERSKDYPEVIHGRELFIQFFDKYGWEASATLQYLVENYQK